MPKMSFACLTKALIGPPGAIRKALTSRNRSGCHRTAEDAFKVTCSTLIAQSSSDVILLSSAYSSDSSPLWLSVPQIDHKVSAHCMAMPDWVKECLCCCQSSPTLPSLGRCHNTSLLASAGQLSGLSHCDLSQACCALLQCFGVLVMLLHSKTLPKSIDQPYTSLKHLKCITNVYPDRLPDSQKWDTLPAAHGSPALIILVRAFLIISQSPEGLIYQCQGHPRMQ